MFKFPFKTPNNPAPISLEVTRKIRFEEVDMMGIAWHGNYASFFDDARKEIGDLFNFSYLDFVKAKIKVPIKHIFVDYIIPLKFDELIKIKATMYWTDAARINIGYKIINQDNKTATMGYTVQLLMNDKNELLLEEPLFFQEFKTKWKNNLLEL